MTFEEIANIPPYSVEEGEKEKILTERLIDLTRLHQEKCPEYRRMLQASGVMIDQVGSYKEWLKP